MILNRYGLAYCSHVLKVGYEIATYIQQEVTSHIQTQIDYSPNPQWILNGPTPYYQMVKGFMLEYQEGLPIFLHTPCGSFKCLSVPFGTFNLHPTFLRKNLEVFQIHPEVEYPLEGVSIGPFKEITKWKNTLLDPLQTHSTQHSYLSSKEVADLWLNFCFQNGLKGPFLNK